MCHLGALDRLTSNTCRFLEIEMEPHSEAFLLEALQRNRSGSSDSKTLPSFRPVLGDFEFRFLAVLNDDELLSLVHMMELEATD